MTNRELLLRKRAAQRAKRRGVLSLLVVALFISVNLTIIIRAKSNSPQTYKSVVVEEGDTLWSIAKENCGQGDDLRKAVYQIMKANDLKTADIYVGQDLKLLSN